MRIPKSVRVFGLIFFGSTWMLMCGFGISALIRNFHKGMDELAWGPLDVVRRYTSPTGDNTAILVRSYGSFAQGMNFILYITDNEMADVIMSTEKDTYITKEEFACSPDCAIWIRRALWISNDYDPSTYRNWHEDLVWSIDGNIIAVVVEDKYVFAYDLVAEQRYEEAGAIEELFKSHNK